MKRRDFIRVSSAAGVAAIVTPGFDAVANSAWSGAEGFDLHPFIKEHPEAVFINLTSVQNKVDTKGIHDAAFKLANEMFVKTSNGEGFPNTTKITCKPNWTCNNYNDENKIAQMGVNTDGNFVEGFLKAVKTKGPQEFYLRECACSNLWEANGWTAMAERNNFDLRDLSSKDFWDLGKDDIIFKEVDGNVFKQVAFMAPMTAPNTFLINIAKFKAHMMGITASIKNLQGITAKKFHSYCGGHYNIFKTYDKRYHEFFQPDYMQRIAELHQKHLNSGIPRWKSKMDRPPYGGGMFMEQWVQRMLDSYSITPTGINIVEGIYGRDGDGFANGPHDGKGMDFMSNNIIFGKDAFRVDIITHWLAGHEPGNFGLFHIGIERGLSDVLDPNDIPVYLWENGQAKLVKLDSLKRTPLLSYYLRRNYDGMNEDMFHMCDEPFDYGSWKMGKSSQNVTPDIRAIGTDSNDNVIMEVSVPEKSDVYVDILNRHGDVVWRMHAPDLEPGKHQVVWDGFSQPGMYNMYVKGMSWDAEHEMVIYT
ncbi:MAG TPA: DUF362 domain-containing protein [Draconibacterium sp.]|nr:DUF362 domain-containing protein [Draconibacterium sp.]HRX10066.1 DUF362 domain-containing protein [Draconibacterium sp.]